MSFILGRAQTTFTHAVKSVSLPCNTTSSKESLSLDEICISSTPPCDLNPLLFNGHLQTFWTAGPQVHLPIHYKRKVFTSTDPSYAGQYAVDFVVPFSCAEADQSPSLPPRTALYTDEELSGLSSNDATPMLVALHGLSGGSHELYLRHLLAPLTAPARDNKGGWAACVINSRGCAMSKIINGVLYNARATWDTRQTVRWLRETFPNRPLFAAGFSLGANILTNYLGEEGEHCQFKAALLFSNPWNLETGSVRLQSSYMGRFYSSVMAKSMRALAETHVDELRLHSDIDLEALRKTNFMHEFDSIVQCPTWGYPTVGAYYRDASCSDSLLGIRIPTFAINARDDPIAPDEAIPYDEFRVNPWTVLCTTSHGGHLAWFEFGGGRWFVKPAMNFLETMAREIDLDALGDQIRDATVDDSSGHKEVNGTVQKPIQTPEFDPMRRKMKMPMKALP